MALGLGMFGANSKTSRKLDRKQQRLGDTQSRVNVLRTKRAQADFMEDAQRERLMLNERLAKRGMAGGTHADSERGLLERKIGDRINYLGEDITMAEQGADLQDYEHKAGKRFKSLQLLDELIGGTLQGASFMAGLPGSKGELPPETGTSGLDQSMWADVG